MTSFLRPFLFGLLPLFFLVGIPTISVAATLTSKGNLSDAVHLDVKINKSDGPVKVTSGKKVVVSWESHGVTDDCYLSYPQKTGVYSTQKKVRASGSKKITAYPKSSPFSQVGISCTVSGNEYVKDAVYFEPKFRTPSQDLDVLGSESAKLKVKTYCDTESPFCHSFKDTMYKVLDHYTPGKKKGMKWTYNLFPLPDATGPNAIPEARAAACASLAGNFYYWDGIARLGGGSYKTSEELFTVLQLPESSRTVFMACMNKIDVKGIQDYTNLGIRSGITGVPFTSVFKGKKHVDIEGDVKYEEMIRLIDSL